MWGVITTASRLLYYYKSTSPQKFPKQYSDFLDNLSTPHLYLDIGPILE